MNDTAEIASPKAEENIDSLCANTIRFLSLDMVQKAKSGHPGTPMGAAEVGYILWDRFLRHSPTNPSWFNRDRFVLSAGHACALQYSLLHLTGYDLTMEDLKAFRQWGSRTPGHPEYGLTPGVNATTGPLGQGFANGIGMAAAEKILSDQFNKPGYDVVDHRVFEIVSDGDLQEGVSAEAASLAGTWGLGKILYIYDSNGIQIEGKTDVVFRENVAERFESYGWRVVGPIDGSNMEAVEDAIRYSLEREDKPKLIISKSTIGRFSPLEGTAKVHGEAMTDAEAKESKLRAGWPADKEFYVPDAVYEHMRLAVDRGKRLETEWNELVEDYSKAHPSLAEKFRAQIGGNLEPGWDTALDSLFSSDSKPMATRDASGKVINTLAGRLQMLVGGSADLAPSTKTIMEGTGDFPFEAGGRNFHFGVREHAMGAIANGIALHGGLIPYTATFLTFSDYMKPALRLAALSHLRVVNVFTHDSIGLGEDGPTHQPVEHLMALRAIPNMTVIRPADSFEVAEAWKVALRNTHGPTAIVLTRQKVPVFDREKLGSSLKLEKGAYILWQSSNLDPKVILIATGSEVALALEAAKVLASQNTPVRVVSMPSWELFDAQPKDYKDSVLPPHINARVAVEAGTSKGWERYVGLEGRVVGLNRFGASAPGQIVMEKLGFTVDSVVAAAKEVLQRAEV
ncbi:MAG: transketolase [Thermoprotei archaeon]